MSGYSIVRSGDILVARIRGEEKIRDSKTGTVLRRKERKTFTGCGRSRREEGGGGGDQSQPSLSKNEIH